MTDAELYARFAANTRDIMLGRGLKQIDIAGPMGVSPSQVSRLLSGNNGCSPRLSTVRLIAQVLEVDPSELLAPRFGELCTSDAELEHGFW